MDDMLEYNMFAEFTALFGLAIKQCSTWTITIILPCLVPAFGTYMIMVGLVLKSKYLSVRATTRKNAVNFPVLHLFQLTISTKLNGMIRGC